ncbi:hypothetical protein SISSUDRAFT_1067864 [Sistotremastrum suecicum HHB10207 ss-3]|uniref:Uncharacterized protein n=1 Tax=Sistotremastrum suecicum HHB10207 ss-3 TaxID=1314776 RepID=A0A165WM01_9AGAM|nr:hypothetical protein SISSUDRAFT_1067864 [Sistotremastrum suecicum HHB10207 ss-3]
MLPQNTKPSSLPISLSLLPLLFPHQTTTSHQIAVPSLPIHTLADSTIAAITSLHPGLPGHPPSNPASSTTDHHAIDMADTEL